MLIPARHWLDYDSVALTVLMIAISILELFVFCLCTAPPPGVSSGFCALYVQN
jgi:hypothetical protein